MKLIPISYWSPYWMYWLLCGFVASFLASLLFKRIYNSLIPRLLQHTHEPSQTTSDVSSELSYNSKYVQFMDFFWTQTNKPEVTILDNKLVHNILTGVNFSVEFQQSKPNPNRTCHFYPRTYWHHDFDWCVLS